MKQIVLSKLVIDGVAIAIYGVNIICTEICCSLLQNNFSKVIRDFIILVDGICQVIRNRCVNIISIITILLNVVCTRLTIFSNQCVRRTINSYRGFAIIIAISQAGNSYCTLEVFLNSCYIAIGLSEALARNAQAGFVDFKVTLCLDDFVVDACTILEADIFHVDSIFIRIWISVCCRTTGLILSIAAVGLDGKVTGALVELIVIDNGVGAARYAFLIAGERCSEFPVVDGCVAVGLAAAAVDVDLASENLDGAAIFCGCIGIAARFTKIRQIVAI